MLEAAMAAGLNPVPVALGGPEDAGKILEFGGMQIEIHGPSDRESVLSSTFKDHPDLIVVDYTVPAAVNGKHMLILLQLRFIEWLLIEQALEHF